MVVGPRTETPHGHLQSRNDLGVTSHDRASLYRFRKGKQLVYYKAFVWVVIPLRVCPRESLPIQVSPSRNHQVFNSLVFIRDPCQLRAPATER